MKNIWNFMLRMLRLKRNSDKGEKQKDASIYPMF
ncbi:hypothetical protein B0G80_1186 [Paraburkholderia sp. BL6669N2]|nr:hypothetical protein B0G80_1186 [Paraburkholderia sp. BL6669N2]